ncbi:MAG: protein translocase subunit SecD [Eubacterium sp.]|nr:protein translocase subunit SecD [Eubacterium sp.]
MNNKAKGVLQILLVLVLIAAFAYVAVAGIGSAHKGKAENIRLGLDLKGGVSVTYQANKANPTEEEMEDTKSRMQKRIEDISTEAAVYREGENRITADIPGVTNSAEVLQRLGKAGSLQFVMYEKLKKVSDESVSGVAAGTLTGSSIATDEASPSEGDYVTFDEKDIELDGSYIKDAEATTNQDQTTGASENVVLVKFNSKGAKKFGDLTGENVGNQLAIVYDGQLVSAPRINEAITGGECTISGGFEEFSEASDLATTLRIGALPLELTNIHDNVVGATLGANALSTSLTAGVIGLILVIIFMIVMYRLPGVAAAIALIFYVGAMLLTLNVLNVTLTLPGIAGIILSIGMAVDANCIIFTRIREELTTGKTVHSAIKLGFSKALSAIVDGNITTLIAAFVLYLKGSGTVKGFAETLAIGIILSMITALLVTRLLMEAFAALGLTDVKFYGTIKERKTIDFIGNWKKYVTISGIVFVLCIAGLAFNASKGSILNYSLDFIGGTSTAVNLPENKAITDADKETALDIVKDSTGLEGEVSTSSDNGVNKITVRTTALSEDQAEAVRTNLSTSFGVDKGNVESETISASVSDEMKTNAVVATLIAAICMLIYIWIRFRKLSTGVSAVLALVHDIITVFTVYVVFSHFIQVGSTFIACMLTIVGYSINDTIVVFDRIRENRKKASARTPLAETINKSITETLSRSINTSVTTLIMVAILAILGVSAVRQFAIPMIVGVIAGCYSSICVASPLWYLLSGKGEKNVQKGVTYSKKK